MTHNQKLHQARRDLRYMMLKYGQPYDMCGAVCNNDMLDNLILGKRSMTDTIIDYISGYFEKGIETPFTEGRLSVDLDDIMTAEIKERWNI